MRASILAFVLLCGVIAGTVILMNRQKPAPPVPAPVVESSPGPSATTEQTAAQVQPPPAISQNANPPAPAPSAAPVAGEVRPDDSTNAVAKAVDALLTAKDAGEKHALFEQLRQSGQLNEVIAELKQRMAQNPNDPEIPTTLGEAQLNQVRAIKETGGDMDQIGILAMQADQNFNAALDIDPKNWEAQFVKAASLSRWPADAARDNDLVQRLSSLIDQQETMATQPEFAQTYLVLGNEYQKIGQPEKALATWQLGAQKFPNEPALQKKISGQ